MTLGEMRFLVHGPAVSLADIMRTEDVLGCRFPDDYRRFFLRFNGGRSVPCESKHYGLTMTFWFAITESDRLPVYSIVLANRHAGEELKGAFCILGETAGGLYLVMRMRRPGLHRIGVWNHEEDEVADAELVFAGLTDMLSHMVHVERIVVPEGR
jgi:hypothetical protein